MLLAFLSLALAASAPGEKPSELPKGPAPLVMLATFGHRTDGVPYLEIVATRHQLETREVTVQVGERTEKRLETVLVPVPVTTRFLLNEKVMTFQDIDGKKIDLEDVPRLLGTMSPVLVSADGKDVDPFYLKAAREGTVVIVSQALARSSATPLTRPGGR